MTAEDPHCFAIMPISDPSDYQEGHFNHVFEDIIKPASEGAGYMAVRADQVKETNLGSGPIKHICKSVSC